MDYTCFQAPTEPAIISLQRSSGLQPHSFMRSIMPDIIQVEHSSLSLTILPRNRRPRRGDDLFSQPADFPASVQQAAAGLGVLVQEASYPGNILHERKIIQHVNNFHSSPE
jgi:hypothetical protein